MPDEDGPRAPRELRRAREVLSDAGWLFDDFVNAEMRRVLVKKRPMAVNVRMTFQALPTRHIQSSCANSRPRSRSPE